MTHTSAAGTRHQNVSRKRAYYRGLDVTAGEPATPFVRAVIGSTTLFVDDGPVGIARNSAPGSDIYAGGDGA